MTDLRDVQEFDDSQPYEWHRFEVGERCRVRLSPECKCNPRPGSAAYNARINNHPGDIDGREGVVTETDATMLDGHRYKVVFNLPYLWRGIYWDGQYFAASELEPLDQEASRYERV